MPTLAQTDTPCLPTVTEACQAEVFQIAILHQGRWQETRVKCSARRAIELAENAGRRSGLSVSVRDSRGGMVFERSACA